MKLAGLILLVVSVLVGAVLVVLGVTRPGANVDGFARADFGCLTTLRFDTSGDYWIYLVDGDSGDGEQGGCAPTASGAATEVTVTSEGADIVLRRDSKFDVSIDGDDAESLYRFEVDTAGEYQVSAVTDRDGQSLAIGGDPYAGRTVMLVAGLAVGLLGAALGIVLLILGRKRSSTAGPSAVGAPAIPPAVPATGWTPTPHAPTAPQSQPLLDDAWRPTSPSEPSPQPAARPSEAPGPNPPGPNPPAQNPYVRDPNVRDPWSPPDESGRRG